MITAKSRRRIIKVVPAIEVRHVRSPQASQARHVFHGPFGQMSEHITAQLPVNQIFRTSDRDTRSRRKNIIGIPLLDNAWIMDLTDVTPGLCI